MHAMERHIVTVRCADRPGLVAAVAGAVAAIGGNIVEADQHTDAGVFCQRLVVVVDRPDQLASQLQQVSDAFEDPVVGVWPARRTARLAVAVSSTGHCLWDLAGRCATGDLDATLTVVVSDTTDQAATAERLGVPFVHVPAPSSGADAGARSAHDAAVADALAGPGNVDVVVLARYMRIVGSGFIDRFGTDRIINIHHSFLPAFVGANPYEKAHARGVKLIGATAHYVTAELDAGPIIAQQAATVTHRASAADLRRQGRDLEALTLADAVRAHLDHRVFVVGNRTTVL
jgi:formyltetrahydrofolate deformylase